MSAAAVELDAGWGRLLAAVQGRHVAEERRPAETEIDALRRQDPDAWKSLFAAELDAVYRYCLVRTGKAEDAEDLASGVFEEAWRHAESLEDRGLPARAWLFGIARNLVNGHRRKLLRRAPQVAIEAYDAPAEEAALDPERMDLARAVASMPAAQAEVITLRFVHGLSLAETADVLHTSIDGVKGRQARALAELRERLEGRTPAITSAGGRAARA